MAGNNGGSPVTHFGKQARKERLARGWSIHELSARTGIAAGHLSRIENGKRPPTENVAARLDAVFPERRGYFTELYDEMRTWAPPGFRDWPELEAKATRLGVWSPGVIDGLAQTEDYARGLLETLPGATAEAVNGRLATRMARQRHVLFRDDPPSVRFIVDELALYRRVGSAEVMTDQMRHLVEVASLPHVTVEVLPAAAHPATASGFLVGENAAFVEHVLGGGVYTEDQTLTILAGLFDNLRDECYRVSESLAIIRRAEGLWTGERAATAERKVHRA
jgi:transcriptional regulator with XRE-family HTH domain